MTTPNKLKYIFILILSSFIFFSHFDITQATTMNGSPKMKETIINGSNFIQYISTCTPNADTKPTQFGTGSKNWKKMNNNFEYENISVNYNKINSTYDGSEGNKGNFIFSERSIIYPVGLTDAKRIYIYWHGIGWNEHTTQEMCNGTTTEGAQQVPYTEFCKRAAEMGDSIIIAPRTLNTGSHNQVLTSDELKCLFDEVKTILKTKNVKTENAKIILTGHSGGGQFIGKSLLNSAVWTGTNQILTAIFFDSTYDGWGTAALSANKNIPIFIYYSESGTPKQYSLKDIIGYKTNDKGEKVPIYRSSNEWKEAQDTKIQGGNRVKILEIKSSGHDAVINQCFFDHLDGKGCVPKGSFLPINYKDGVAFTNSFETIDGVSATIKYESNSQPQTLNLVTQLNGLIKNPKLQIKIPGLNITDGVSFIQRGGNIYLQSTIFQQYLVAVYKYSVVAISILAVIMIIVAGIQWLISGGSPDKINVAKKRISGSIIGIILAVGSYTILYTINPNLIDFSSLETLYIPEEGEEEELPLSFYNTTSNVSLAPGTPIDAKDAVFPLTKESLLRNADNFGQPRGDEKRGLRCHAGVDLYTKPPGTVVAIDDGVVLYIDTAYMKADYGCKGTEANQGKYWSNAEKELQKGQVGSMLIYHPNLGITAFYGEINQPDIETFIKQNSLNGRDGKFYRNIKNVTVTKGQILGTASRCGMLHFELYTGKKDSYTFWNPTPKQSFVNQTHETKNYCSKPEIMNLEGYPENLINANLLLPNIKSFLQ